MISKIYGSFNSLLTVDDTRSFSRLCRLRSDCTCEISLTIHKLFDG